MYQCFVRMYVCTHACCLWKSEEGMRFCWSWITDDCERPTEPRAFARAASPLAHSAVSPVVMFQNTNIFFYFQDRVSL